MQDKLCEEEGGDQFVSGGEAEGGRSPGGGVDVGASYMVRRGEGTWCQAEIIQKRYNDAGKDWEYYVHYENYNRRLEEWVMRNRMISTTTVSRQ